MRELLEQLEEACASGGLDKFSPAEIVELLEDGEEVEWIVEQLTRGRGSDELSRLLGQIAAEIAPASRPGGGEGEVAAGASAPEGGAATSLDWEALQGMLPSGVDIGQVEQVLNSPRGALLADFGAFCQEQGADAAATAEMGEELQALHEEWLQTPRPALEGKRPAEVLEGGRLLPARIETVRRQAPKVGRNDPCPCGSGRKYKKCCGKAA